MRKCAGWVGAGVYQCAIRERLRMVGVGVEMYRRPCACARACVRMQHERVSLSVRACGARVCVRRPEPGPACTCKCVGVCACVYVRSEPGPACTCKCVGARVCVRETRTWSGLQCDSNSVLKSSIRFCVDSTTARAHVCVCGCVRGCEGVCVCV